MQAIGNVALPSLLLVWSQLAYTVIMNKWSVSGRYRTHGRDGGKTSIFILSEDVIVPVKKKIKSLKLLYQLIQTAI